VQLPPSIQEVVDGLRAKIHALEQRLQESEIRFRLVSQSSHEAIYDWDLLTNRLDWSSGMQSLFHYSAEEIGKGIEWWDSALHPEDHDRVIASLQDAMDNRHATWEAAYRFCKKDGTFALVFDRGSFLFDRDRKPVRMIGTMLDVTEEKKAQREREHLSDLLQNLVSNIPGVVWEAWGPPDSTWQRNEFISEYAVKLLGHAIEEWLQKPNFWLTIVHPDDRLRAAREAAEIFKRGSGSFRFRWLRKDGEPVWMEAFCANIFDDQGNAIGMRGVTLDINERVRAEQERDALLEQLREALHRTETAVAVRDEFLAVASHELRTPLQSLQLQMQALSRFQREGTLTKLPASSLQSILAIGDQQMRRVTSLVADLLDVSRLTSGHLILEREPCDLSALVAEILERFVPDVEQNKIMLTRRLAPGVNGLWDRKRIDQVVTNLVANALKYGQGKPIEVEVGTEGDEAVFRVADHGIGISPADKQRIFEQWERAVSSRNFAGLGLGLYITRRIVEMHQGTIEVDSQLGQGAKFTVRLPLSS
jgi:PAS domain S-box-containing protein